jgi:hypothetical protein
MQKRGTKSLKDPSVKYSKMNTDVSPETKQLIKTIMFDEDLLLWQVIEKAIQQYNKPIKAPSKPQKTSAPKPNKTSPAPFALDSERQCGTCEEVKPLSDFYNSSSGKYGVEAHCKNCKNAKTTARRSLKN